MVRAHTPRVDLQARPHGGGISVAQPLRRSETLTARRQKLTMIFLKRVFMSQVPTQPFGMTVVTRSPSRTYTNSLSG